MSLAVTKMVFCSFFILLSSKLGLDAGSPGSSGSSGSGSSALTLPTKCLGRGAEHGQGGHCTQRTCPRGVGADCINLTA